jgi:hypothetical protein
MHWWLSEQCQGCQENGRVHTLENPEYQAKTYDQGTHMSKLHLSLRKFKNQNQYPPLKINVNRWAQSKSLWINKVKPKKPISIIGLS